MTCTNVSETFINANRTEMYFLYKCKFYLNDCKSNAMFCIFYPNFSIWKELIA